MSDRIRIRAVTVLSDDWYLLKKTTFDFRRSDGSWQTLNRETYDRGNGAVVLLVNSERRTVLLTRQFRYPAFVNGLLDGMLLEACAGLLDSEDPEETIRREVEEETGFRIGPPQKLFELYMSPGSVTEKLFFYLAEYDHSDRVSSGGGDQNEGEDIEIVELTFDQAFAMMDAGEIQDAKTLILLQRLAMTAGEHRGLASAAAETT
ncbi:MAG TPA: NUDIX domain-containing protein [Terrimicrobiaceae bacterium]|jgi:nudix-type nucleoside diphosphatase (YffH/AdpP family)